MKLGECCSEKWIQIDNQVLFKESVNLLDLSKDNCRCSSLTRRGRKADDYPVNVAENNPHGCGVSQETNLKVK